MRSGALARKVVVYAAMKQGRLGAELCTCGPAAKQILQLWADSSWLGLCRYQTAHLTAPGP
jgi:hypothetical protein